MYFPAFDTMLLVEAERKYEHKCFSISWRNYKTKINQIGGKNSMLQLVTSKYHGEKCISLKHPHIDLSRLRIFFRSESCFSRPH